MNQNLTVVKHPNGSYDLVVTDSITKPGGGTMLRRVKLSDVKIVTTSDSTPLALHVGTVASKLAIISYEGSETETL